MKKLNEYSRYVLIGGGVVADRMAPQLLESGLKRVGVADNLGDDRKIKVYDGDPIRDLSCYRAVLKETDVCAVLAINAFFSIDVIRYYEQLELDIDKLFLPNPYTSLRPCVMNDEFAAEKRIPVDDPIYDQTRLLFSDEESLRIYDKLRNSKTYDSATDTFDLVAFPEIKDMYYFAETYWHNYDFKPTKNEFATVIDCGAYIGDSILQVCRDIPEQKIVYYAFEPDHDNAQIIRNNSEFSRVCYKLEALEYGVGNANKALGFEFPSNLQKDAGRFVDVGDDYDGIKLEIRRMDDLDLDIKGQLYIKMDIEGSELDALKGGERLIRKHRPFLAICVYHRKNDVIDIPNYINSLGCDYKFFLRCGFHTILWAIPKEA